ncbi:MAG: exodeoxyribonuclease III [Alphaproteobacteria bacterium]|nr:exodeoxyribonuclease III [Alphaproteobacteria bacterium]
MNILSWNINSVRARLAHVEKLLEEKRPDVLFLQETKTDDFPSATFQKSGYEIYTQGQKTYNGVAILSRKPLNILRNALTGDDTDTQARFLEAETDGLRLINIYAPNGNPVDSEKFPYKLRWLERLYTYLKTLREARIPFLVGGDFNIIPEEKDCFDPVLWSGDALFRMETRHLWRRILHLGLTDAYRIFDDRPHTYTFWDYQAGCWPADKGIRIDHFLLSPEIADRVQRCWIDRGPRGWDKPSDHTPIGVDIS